MTVASEKPQLRRAMLSRVRALTTAERASYDRTICDALVQLPCFRDVVQILAYRALPEEVCLERLFDGSRWAGKALFLPVVLAESTLGYRRWRATDVLRRSSLGVEEPVGGDVPETAATLLLTPALAFDRDGYRLGRGRGCYDRTLPAWAGRAAVVGVAYSCQIVDRLPRDAHDRSVDLVVSEAGVIRVRNCG